MHAASAGLKSDVSTINASRAIDGIPALFAPDVMLMMVSVGGEFRGFAYGPLPLISQNEAKTGIIEHENARLKELLEEANSRAEAWHDKYNRDVEGVNNEGDAIGGEPPFGLRHAVDYFKAVVLGRHPPEACFISYDAR